MNNSSNPAATGTSGGPATTSNEALTARGFFNPMPPPQDLSRAEHPSLIVMDSTNTAAAAAAAAIASGTPARAEAAAAGYCDNNSRNWTLGRAEPRTRSTILEIKDPKPLLRAQEAAPGTPTARHLRWRTPTTKRRKAKQISNPFTIQASRLNCDGFYK
jgi:hypothetical protein